MDTQFCSPCLGTPPRIRTLTDSKINCYYQLKAYHMSHAPSPYILQFRLILGLIPQLMRIWISSVKVRTDTFGGSVQSTSSILYALQHKFGLWSFREVVTQGVLTSAKVLPKITLVGFWRTSIDSFTCALMRAPIWCLFTSIPSSLWIKLHDSVMRIGFNFKTARE